MPMTTTTMRKWYDDILDMSDHHSRSWPLMSSPMVPLGTMVTYLAVVYFGPKVMKDRKPWNVQQFLAIYNLCLVVVSAYMCSEFLLVAIDAKYSLLCEPIDNSDAPTAVRMRNVCWWYYVSKYFELADTVCFILRKKNGQITFLNVWHHATMIPFWWMVVAYIPGGQTFFHPLLNTAIHVMMYTYYGLAALGPHMQPYLWWKKYLTSLQLVQFILIAIHTSYNLWFEPDCPYPKWANALALWYAFVLIALFANFYIKAYTKPTRTTPAVSSTARATTATSPSAEATLNNVGANIEKQQAYGINAHRHQE